MISTFPEAYRVSISSEVWGSKVGLLLGLTKDEKYTQPAHAGGQYLCGVILCENGEIQEIPCHDFTVDFRYVPEKDAFFDLDAITQAEVAVDDS